MLAGVALVPELLKILVECSTKQRNICEQILQSCIPGRICDRHPRDRQDFSKMQHKLKEFQSKVCNLASQVVSVIDIPGIGKTAAKTICDEMKIKTQGDKKLEEAKKMLYLKGFYDGVMVIGPHTGKKVCYCAGLWKSFMML